MLPKNVKKTVPENAKKNTHPEKQLKEKNAVRVFVDTQYMCIGSYRLLVGSHAFIGKLCGMDRKLMSKSYTPR